MDKKKKQQREKEHFKKIWDELPEKHKTPFMKWLCCQTDDKVWMLKIVHVSVEK